MQFQSVKERHLMEVPNDDICLESHMGLLAWSDVVAALAHCYGGNLIIVSSEEVLGPADDVSDHNCRSERVDEVFVHGMQDHSVDDFACEADDGLNLQLLFHNWLLINIQINLFISFITFINYHSTIHNCQPAIHIIKYKSHYNHKDPFAEKWIFISKLIR